MSNPPDIPFFGYGTLQLGQRNNFRMEDMPRVGRGLTVKPLEFLDISMSFPGMTLEEGPSRVQGDVYLVDKRNLRWNDHFECVPDNYKRGKVMVEITTGDHKGRVVECVTYIWQKPRGYRLGSLEIINGRWPKCEFAVQEFKPEKLDHHSGPPAYMGPWRGYAGKYGMHGGFSD